MASTFYASPSRPGLLKKFSLSSVSDSNVFLWHNHLGHPNFNYLKYLYLDLFLNKEMFLLSIVSIVSLLNNLANIIQTTLIMHPNPFHLIHNDIWGLAHVPNITGARWFITFIDVCAGFIF